MYDIIVLGNLRFRPSTRKREAGFFKNQLENVFEKMHFRWQFSPNTYVWTVGKNGKNIRLFKQNRDKCGQGLGGAVLLAPVVQKVDNAIHRINHYPLDSAIGFLNTYPLESDLTNG